MASFEDQGYCTVDALAPGGLSEAELDAAEETWDRLIAGGGRLRQDARRR